MSFNGSIGGKGGSRSITANSQGVNRGACSQGVNRGACSPTKGQTIATSFGNGKPTPNAGVKSPGGNASRFASLGGRTDGKK